MRRIGVPLAAMLLTIALATVLGSRAWAQTYPPPVGSLTVTGPTTAPSTGDCDALAATVLDDAGDPLGDRDVTFTIVSQPGDDASLGSLSETAKTDENGIATVTLCVGSNPGDIIIQVVAGELTSQLTVQVLGAALPPTGGPPPQDNGGFAYWLIALIAGSAVAAGGLLAILARRLFKA